MVLFTFEGLIIVGHKACTYPFLILYLAEIGSSYIRYKLLLGGLLQKSNSISWYRWIE